MHASSLRKHVPYRLWAPWQSLRCLSSLLQALEKTAPLMREQQAYRYTAQRTNFFTLVRFDFMMDENLDVYLIEVGCTHKARILKLCRLGLIH